MKPAAGSHEREVLHGCDNSTGHQKNGVEPEPRYCKKCDDYKKGTIVLTVAFAVLTFGLLIAVIVLAVLSGRSSAVLGPCCPDGWVGYQGKCYYFSEAEGNWNKSQSNCSSLGASLAGINTLQDLDFLLRYKGFDHWIGLRRDPGQPWKWANGTKFNNLLQIGGRGGDCAYLNSLGGVSSLQCTREIHWICTKPDVFTRAQETATEGDS